MSEICSSCGLLSGLSVPSAPQDVNLLIYRLPFVLLTHQCFHRVSTKVSTILPLECPWLLPLVSLKSVHSASPECPPECPWCSLRVSPDRWFHLLQHNACRQKSPCWVCAVCCVPLCSAGPPAGWVSLTLWCGFSDWVGDVFTFLS